MHYLALSAGCKGQWVTTPRNALWSVCFYVQRGEGIPWGVVLSLYSLCIVIVLNLSLHFLYDQLLAHLLAEDRCQCASENNQVYSYSHMHVVVLQTISFSACEKLKKKKK